MTINKKRGVTSMITTANLFLLTGFDVGEHSLADRKRLEEPCRHAHNSFMFRLPEIWGRGHCCNAEICFISFRF